MSKKVLSLILGAALIAGFFLPLGANGKNSAFDFIQSSFAVSGIEPILLKYGWILIPVSGLLLIIGALNNGHYVPARVIWAVLPLLVLAYFIVRPVTEGFDIGSMVKAFGIGYWLMIGAALILAVYHPKKA
ncbi:MAG: hypothetical protein SGI83_06375 [Bacteroidota bacterium]|nr:hypothetical protein [Bacteroidota bacterium]